MIHTPSSKRHVGLATCGASIYSLISNYLDSATRVAVEKKADLAES